MAVSCRAEVSSAKEMEISLAANVSHERPAETGVSERTIRWSPIVS